MEDPGGEEEKKTKREKRDLGSEEEREREKGRECMEGRERRPSSEEEREREKGGPRVAPATQRRGRARIATRRANIVS
jgi:hypothetical protein